MATSGSKSITVTDWDTLKFSWWQTSQNVANNTTTIGWKMELIATTYGYINSSASKEWAVTVNGTKYSGTNSIGINNNSTKTLASGSTPITHDADGEKTFSYSFSQEFNMSFNGQIGTKSGSGTGTLDPIPRASQPSCVTWPEHTQDVGYFGETISIHMNRASSAFTHTVRYTFGPASALMADIIDENVTTGTTWKIPVEMMNLLPAQTSGSGRIYVDTYNGSKLIGTKYCVFTAKVPASVAPSVKLTLEDVTGIDDIYGSPVQGLSKIKVTATPTLAYKSPIASYEIAVDGMRYTTTPITTAPLRITGNSGVSVNVIDQRKRWAADSYTMKVLPYTPPSVSALSVRRCDEDGTANDQGDHIRVEFTAAITSLNGKNTARYTLKYKKTTETSYTPEVLSDYTNVYAVNGGFFIFSADINSTYDVEIEALDRHSAATRATSASTAFSLLNFGADGKSMALGKGAEKSNSFEVALDNYFYGTTIQTGNRYSLSTPGEANSSGYILMARLEITAANADTPITFVFSRRQAESTMTVYVALRNSTTTASSLSSIRYEGTNYGAFLVQSADMIWDLYVQKGSSWDTIAMQDWYTSHTMEGRVDITFPGTLISSLPGEYYRATPAKLDSLLDHIYPVGSVYINYGHTNPATLFGGTWQRIENAFLWGVDSSGTIGQTGGEKTHTLTVNELPKHTHGSVYSANASGTKTHAWIASGGSNMAYGTVETGGGAAHNNMPPYVQVSIWRRTA